MQQIEFRCTEDTYGLPNPYIPDGTIVIIVQDGEAKIGKYEEPTPPENPFPAFSHPLNTDRLKQEALQIVLKNYSDTNLYGNCLFYVCPDKLASKAIWRN